MGNALSSEDEYIKQHNEHNKLNIDMANYLNDIASQWIHTINEDDLKKLAQGDLNFCNNLIILSAQVLNEKYNNLELKNIYRSKYNENYENYENYENNENNDLIYFSLKHDNLDIEKEKKQKLCIEISKFYVKVAHIFATIIKTLNPVFKDKNGMIRSYFNKNRENNNEETLIFKGICDKRYNYLLFDILDKFNDDKNIILKKSTICDSKYDTDVLNNIGIQVLKYLYSNNNEYENDVLKKFETLYKNNKNDSIKDYDIENDRLKEFFLDTDSEYKNNKNNKNNNDFKFNHEKFDNKINLPNKNAEICSKIVDDIILDNEDEGIRKYINHLNFMLTRIKEHKIKLINILNNEIFIKKNKSYVINKDLTYDKLNNITEYVRKIIINLYLTCEEDYLNALKILEYIIENDNKIDNEKYNKLQLDSLKNIMSQRNSISKENMNDNYDSDKLMYNKDKLLKQISNNNLINSQKIERNQELVPIQKEIVNISTPNERTLKQSIPEQLNKDISKIKQLNPLKVDLNNSINNMLINISKNLLEKDIIKKEDFELINKIYNFDDSNLDDLEDLKKILKEKLNDSYILVLSNLDKNKKELYDNEFINEYIILYNNIYSLFKKLDENNDNSIKTQIYYSIRKNIIYVIKYIFFINL